MDTNALPLTQDPAWQALAAILFLYRDVYDTQLPWLNNVTRAKRPKPLPLVGMERLATGMALDVDKLAAWQSARILHVQHGPLGRVTDASIVR